jgi:hypothetical protein
MPSPEKAMYSAALDKNVPTRHRLLCSPHSGWSYGKNKQDEHPVSSRSSIAASRTVVREDILICAGEPFRREGSKRLVLICAKGMIPEQERFPCAVSEGTNP